MIFSHLGDVFQQRGTDPEAFALLSPERSPSTYGALHRQIQYVAETLDEHGIGRTDRVAIVLPNGPEMATAFLGVAARATSAPLNPGHRSEEFNFYLDDLAASAVIVETSSRSVVREVARRRQIPVIELQPSADTTGVFSLSGTTGRDPIQAGPARSSDVALVLHTSGTTARPKIVALTHANLCVSAAQIQASLGLTPADRCLNVMPLFHIHGLIGALLSSLQSGGGVFCAPGFSAGSFAQWLTQSAATWYTAVPAMHHALVQEVGGKAWLRGSSLRFVRSCSSALPPQLMADLERALGVPVVEAYGMTECSHQIAVNPLPPAIRKPGSVGLPSGTEVAVLGSDGNLLPRGAVGELVVRGDSVIGGSARTNHVDAEAFTNGWFKTGDQGYVDEDGYIFITGRLKEMINRGGEKIAPREVDEILLLHPAVAQCVTFGAPHPTLGEEVAAAIVVRAGSDVTPQQLQEFASTHISEFKVPRRIVILDDLPKGPTGKLQRVGLADRLGVTFHPNGAGRRRPRTEPVGERETALVTAMAKVLGLPAASTTDSFFDIGGTSLHAAEFVCAIRAQYGWKLTLTHLYRRPTVRELAQLIPTLESPENLQLEDPARTVLRFNPDGRLPALVFLHGSVEAAACCSELALQCGPDQPIFVLPAHGANGEPIPPTVEEMAAESMTLVHSLGARGPYVLIGYRRSAPIALELARQFEQKGEAVKTLVIIDAAIENTHVAMRWLKRVVSLERTVRRQGSAAGLQRFLTVRRGFEVLERWWWRTRHASSPASGANGSADWIAESYRRARRGYVPTRCGSRVLLLKRAGAGFDARWLKVAPSLEVAELTGTHHSCLTDNVPALCAHLKRALAQQPHLAGSLIANHREPQSQVRSKIGFGHQRSGFGMIRHEAFRMRDSR